MIIYTNVARRCNVLQCVQKYAMITKYLWRYEGGCCDSNGRTIANCRGGSRETAQAAIHGTAYAAGWRHSSLQDTWRMARQVERPAKVHRCAAVPNTRGTLDTLGMLATLPAAQRQSSITVQGLNDYPSPCCLFLLYVILQRLATPYYAMQRYTNATGSVPRKANAMAISPSTTAAPVLSLFSPDRRPRCVLCGCPAFHDVHLCTVHLAAITLLDAMYAEWQPAAREGRANEGREAA